MKTIEIVLEVALADGTKYNLFSDTSGGVHISAESKLVNSRRHTGEPFLKVYKGEDRNSESTHVSSAHIVTYRTVSYPVPADILALGEVPKDETEAEKEIREQDIKNYFSK